MDRAELAAHVLARARALGADAADVILAEGTAFSATIRKGEVDTLTDAGSKAIGLRLFVGRRTATTHSSDLSTSALEALLIESVAIARASGEDPAAGLPDEVVAPEDLDLGLHDPHVAEMTTEARIALAREGEAAALAVSPELTNSHGATFSAGEGSLLLANSAGFLGSYRTSSVSLSVVPVAERDGQMERDYWYTAGRGPADLEPAAEVGRKAAERTLRRLGARRVPTCEVPVVFDPETAAELAGHLFRALSGTSVFRKSTFLEGRLGEQVASPLLTLVDDARRPRGLGSRPFDGEGLPTRRNVPLERGVLRHYLCDTYAARRIGAASTGSARRGVAGGPSVGPSNLFFAPGDTPAEAIVADVASGLYVTDLIGFGVNLVTGDFSQGAVGLWIEGGRLSYPVHEITIAGNLGAMLCDVDAVGDDLVFRGGTASPTLRVARMMISGAVPIPAEVP